MPIPNHKKLNFLIRKNKGTYKLNNYKKFFLDLGLQDLYYIELEQSDDISCSIENTFPFIVPDNEMIEGNSALKNSKLLTEVLSSSQEKDWCYIFTDQVDECGMFKANTISVLNQCLSATKRCGDNTFFLTDGEFRFSFRINYCDEESSDDKDKIYIQRQLREKTLKNEFTT